MQIMFLEHSFIEKPKNTYYKLLKIIQKIVRYFGISFLKFY